MILLSVGVGAAPLSNKAMASIEKFLPERRKLLKAAFTSAVSVIGEKQSDLSAGSFSGFSPQKPNMRSRIWATSLSGASTTYVGHAGIFGNFVYNRCLELNAKTSSSEC